MWEINRRSYHPVPPPSLSLSLCRCDIRAVINNVWHLHHIELHVQQHSLTANCPVCNTPSHSNCLVYACTTLLHSTSNCPLPVSGMVGLAPKLVRLAPNETNPGLFQIRLPRSCLIWGQSDPLWSQNYHPCHNMSGQCGQILALSGSDWPRMGQTRDFFR